MIVPVILSGGSGTRLWPLSTPERPKQFLPLVGELSLFRQTVDRVSDRRSYAPPIVVANSSHEKLCLEGLDGIAGARLILEPCAKNTAVAIAMAARLALDEHGPDAFILVMPSDHLIGEPDRFHVAVAAALEAAETGRLVTFGVQPSGPETGYGYLQGGEAIPGTAAAREVARFTEKPKREVAEQMIAGGDHFWNGGIFLYPARDFLAEIDRLAPEIAGAAQSAMGAATIEGPIVRPPLDALEPCPNLSVDYAVMERSNRVAMVPLDAGWSDIGSWDALAEIASETNQGGLITAVDSKNCYVRSDGLRVGLLGVDDLLVVAVGDRVLIMRKGHSQNVRELAAQSHAEAN